MQAKPTYDQLMARCAQLQAALTSRARTHFDELVDGVGYVALMAQQGSKDDQQRLRQLLSVLNVRKLRAAAMGLATSDFMDDDLGLREQEEQG